jgi:transcriptional regulator with XRE-family HTH domain
MQSQTTRLSNRLRQWRHLNGLTLQEVADLTGVSISMLSRAERGVRVFAPLTKVRIARLLDVHVADLFEIEDEVEVPA